MIIGAALAGDVVTDWKCSVPEIADRAGLELAADRPTSATVTAAAIAATAAISP
jgi:hypothetical protein